MNTPETVKTDAAMSSHLEIFIFVDALGWEIVSSRHFLEDLLPYRKPVRMQFGYSCTAIPTILTGEHPDVHGHLSFFYKAQEKSPFRIFKYLSPFLKPASFWRRGRIRHWVSKLLKAFLGYTGYFQIYAMPFDRLHYFDYCEKRDLFESGGLSPVPNLRDMLEERKLNYLISDWHKPELHNLQEAVQAVSEPDKQFVFVYTAELDGVLHSNVGNDDAINKHLSIYDTCIRQIAEAARKNHESCNITVFSDHGMTPLRGTYDFEGNIAKQGMIFGRDYLSCLDSTMGRFWYNSAEAREKIHAASEGAPGHWMTDEELDENGVLFKDRKFGDEFFLMDAGVQIAPSDMGVKPLPGMHGFHPEDKDSKAAIMSTSEIEEADVREVADYFRLMRRAANSLAESTHP